MKRVRTTLSISQDVYAYARQLSTETGKPLGEIISGLARSGMTAPTAEKTRHGIRLLPVGESATSATLEDVNRLRDEVP